MRFFQVLKKKLCLPNEKTKRIFTTRFFVFKTNKITPYSKLYQKLIGRKMCTHVHEYKNTITSTRKYTKLLHTLNFLDYLPCEQAVQISLYSRI